MLEKRTKLWRRKQGFRVFKKRMIYYASFDNGYFDRRTMEYKRPLHWFELANEKWTRVYINEGINEGIKIDATLSSRVLIQSF